MLDKVSGTDPRGQESFLTIPNTKGFLMANSISTDTRLDILEREINDAAYEAWVYVGQRLAEIREKRLYELADFKNWKSYCASERITFGVRIADMKIATSSLRVKLEKTSTNGSHEWNERQVRELLRCETDKDAVRVAKKAIAQAKKTKSRVTASMIAELRDGDAETGKASAKAEKALDAARLDKHLIKLADILVNWRNSLENVPDDAWDDVPRDVMIRVKTEAAALTKFLRS